ncbi:hypothetical protein [uncultured Secundilactobacillus sp.]|uniref:hypothetical protein n=1 Tax=uncultured Secundilactobacillus sp. TaxID=2813935 RepID=UPI00258C4622|nr:hypothetical protein [uncultured Secundilactobacillus sp.]
MTQVFKDNYQGNNLTYFEIQQDNHHVDEITIDQSKATFDFTICGTTNTYFLSSGNRKLQIDIYALNNRSNQVLGNDALTAQSADVPYDERTNFKFTANFSVDTRLMMGTNYQFLGLDLFYLVESMRDGKYTYSPIFKTLIPFTLGE